MMMMMIFEPHQATLRVYSKLYPYVMAELRYLYVILGNDHELTVWKTSTLIAMPYLQPLSTLIFLGISVYHLKQRSYLCLLLFVCMDKFTHTLIKISNYLIANYHLQNHIPDSVHTFIHLIFRTALWNKLYYSQFIERKIKSKRFN